MKYLSACAVLLLLCLGAVQAMTTDTLSFGRFGTVHIYREDNPPKDVVLFVSGDGGWNLGVVDMAAQLVKLEGAMVIGIDIRHYFKQLQASDAPCLYPAADFEALSQFVQKNYGLETYRTPLLIGYSSGATLVYGLLAQAPANTFGGALSLGFCPDIEINKPLCKGEGLEWEPLPKGNGYNLLPAPKLSHPWYVLEGVIDQVCDYPATQKFVNSVPHSKIVTLEHVGHGFSVEKNWMPQYLQAFRDLSAAQASTAPAIPAAVSSDSLKNLPLVETLATDTSGSTMAIMLSGDGGWSGFDQGVSDEFAKRGIPVVGVNALKYFWKKRSPEESSTDLARIMRYYMATWHKTRVVTAGYSFGADVMPFMVSRLPEDLRSRVALVSLIGPSHNADFEFHVTYWMHVEGKTRWLTLPEVQKLKGMRVLAICDEKDSDSLCNDLPPDAAQAVILKGGHHFNRDYDTIVDNMMDALK
ncbi:MAG TPA: AcvB/VirJ family lysyl-phosphatidylglycerol hydrolase [bacterium]|jgi:type IV secretory pathway VirJ component